jgi:hypothetical protein
MNKKMKKVSLYIMALLSMGLVSCNQDFETIFSPQTNGQESLLQTSDVTVANTTPGTINLADYFDVEAGTTKAVPIGTATVKEGAMPANTILKAVVEFSKNADFSDAIALDANSLISTNEIGVNAQTLQDAYFNNITRNPATTDLYIRTVLYTVTGGTAEAIVGEPGKNYYAESKVTFTPLNKVQISPAYYVIGAAGGWSADGARTQKFQHSGADVYDDPIFTITIDAGSDDCWFAIGDDTALDAIANDNDWTKLLGTKGESEDLTGTMDFRYNLGGEHSFHVKGAKKIRITLDMMEYSYTIEPVNIADAYYLIGGPGEWNAASARTMKFSHSAKDVFEDPVFTYTFEGNGGDMWFAICDDESLNGLENNDWSNVFGTKSGDGNSGESGSLARRSALTDAGSFKVDGKAKFYRVSINMAEMTYEVKALNFQQYIYEAGVNNGWGSTEQPLYCADGNGTYTGFFYAKEDSWTDGKGAFKLRGAADSWDNGNYGTGTLNDDGLTGTLIDDGNSGNIMPAPGFYRADVNLANMTYKLTPIKSVFVVGSALNNDWDNGVEMTYNFDKLCWECDATFTEAGVIKFKGNGTWDTEDGNWGGTADNIINGSNDNIPVSVSGDVHIEFYPLCETKAYCTVTKR